MEEDIKKLKNSLKALQVVFEGLEDYRVLGSVLVAAINGRTHRELHDIDLLIDKRIYSLVEERFKSLGFRQVTKHALVFEWEEFEKPNHLTFGVLLKGIFSNRGFEYNPRSLFGLIIDKEYLQPINYQLYGYSIRGLPVRSIYEGIKIANLNTKRSIDKEVFFHQTEQKIPDGLSLNQAFHASIFGLEIPYLYTIFSHIYNIIGGIRLKLGKPYDPWS